MANIKLDKTTTFSQDIFENVKIPEVRKEIDLSGKETVIRERITQDVINHVYQIVVNYKYTPVDFNDVVTLFQLGESAIVIKIESNGKNHAEQIVSELVENIESAGCQMEDVKAILLHFQVFHTHRPALDEFDTMKEMLIRRMNNYCVLYGLTDDGCESVGFSVTAIVIY